MPNIITCQCGANIRLPETAADRKFRCPNCKLGIAVSVDATVLSSAGWRRAWERPALSVSRRSPPTSSP